MLIISNQTLFQIHQGFPSGLNSAFKHCKVEDTQGAPNIKLHLKKQDSDLFKDTRQECFDLLDKLTIMDSSYTFSLETDNKNVTFTTLSAFKNALYKL